MAQYLTLMTALPSLPSLEKATQLPLSRIALERRLSMLSPDDSQQLALIEQLYFPPLNRGWDQSDQAWVRQWQEAMDAVQSPVLLERLRYHFELRTLLAALRLRSASQGRISSFAGLGRWRGQIQRHWFEPRFGLDTLWPDAVRLCQAFEQQQSGLLEQMLNQLLWRDLWRCEQQHHFMFEAVVCFVLRWGLVERQIKNRAAPALTRFQAQTEQLMRSADSLSAWLKEAEHV
ncbi:hypothetical protein [Neptuniibacter sp. CAU 1671]|uniref:hypothetical protein n=1 Tax=Neptuniibacter sp. CAU 1671 TaxID=3032593 RepID=UPI0023DACDA6|nr:hypothetical protein [Neptuniibacter sp. CAU 1671]MDF2181272.1 hypothetical protein [Neptuniibacter sp. CAU 1671]